MSLNRTAKGVVLVPTLLLGGAFLAAAVWSDGPGGDNRTLAAVLGGLLMGSGLLAQLLPEPAAENVRDSQRTEDQS
ncbi:GIVxVP protein [Cyanobium sp. NS01]|jgi:hypothetical protein|uniref:GIVxVP protein n=1 Tax=Cyanobium sp. NS01 TaxID=261284 RepID=UPI0016479EC7|nr:GIVxVP protein [Cyanobium sp. NS01]QNI70789.1 putative membrane protein [Cyanobium sp. NS01]